MAGIHWVNKSQGARDPRLRALMRITGCLEIDAEWLGIPGEAH